MLLRFVFQGVHILFKYFLKLQRASGASQTQKKLRINGVLLILLVIKELIIHLFRI